jgi:hypothetical protein
MSAHAEVIRPEVEGEEDLQELVSEFQRARLRGHRAVAVADRLAAAAFAQGEQARAAWEAANAWFDLAEVCAIAIARILDRRQP